MYNDFYEHEKSDKAKWIVTFVAIILLAAAVVALGANAFGFTFGDSSIVDTEQPEDNPGNDNNEPLEPAEDEELNTVHIENGSLMKLSAKAYAGNNTKYADGNAIEITINPIPSNATFDELDIYYEWNEPDEFNEYWGIDVNEYVGFDVTGVNTILVYAKQAFGSPVRLTVTDFYNPDIEAFCILEYGQKLGPMEEQLIYTNDKTFIPGGKAFSESLEILPLIEWGSSTEMYNNWYTNGKITHSTVYSSVYTAINMNENIYFTVAVDEFFYEVLEENGLTVSDYTTYNFGSDELTIADVLNHLCVGTLVPLDGSTPDYDLLEEFNEVCAHYEGTVAFTITATVMTDYDCQEFVYFFGFETVPELTGFDFDPDTVIF